MRVWAHRGVSAKAPENTLAAFAAALALDVEGVELDVHLSADGELVVCHDETIDRTSNGTGAIADMTLAQLRAFDFSCVDGRDFGEGARVTGVADAASAADAAHADATRIPTLAEVLALVAPSGKRVNIELKTDKNPYPGIEERVLACVRAADMEQRVVVSSFNRASVARWRALGSGVAACYLFSRPPVGLRRGMARGEWDAVHPRFSCCTRGLVRAAHKAGMPVRVYTVDDERLLRRLARAGVDDVFANDPEHALAVLVRGAL